MIDLGFRAVGTGGLSVDTLILMEGVDVFNVIAGRGITEAEGPAAAAREFEDEIKRIRGSAKVRPNGIYDSAEPKHYTWLES